MRKVTAPVKNVVALAQIGEALRHRDPGVPGVAVIVGTTGYGKTTAAAWWRNKVDAVFVRANSTWTQTALLRAVLVELAEPEGRHRDEMLGRVVRQLRASGRPLIVDEADYLLGDRKMLDTFRDLHDLSNVPLILIGMDGFAKGVKQVPQLAGRISRWVRFGAADAADARVVAEHVCEVKVADDLLGMLLDKAAGSMRGLIVGLSRIEEFARARQLESVDLATWGNRAFTFGDA